MRILELLQEQGLDPIVLENYNKGILMISDNGLRLLTEEEQRLVDECGHKVLHMFPSILMNMRILNMVIKSEYEEDSYYEEQSLQRGLVFVWAKNLAADHCSDMGSVSYEITNGYMRRLHVW